MNEAPRRLDGAAAPAPGLLGRLVAMVPVSLFCYGVVGIALNAFFYCLGLALVRFGWQAWAVILVMNPIGVVVGFLGHKYFSFSTRSRGASRATLPRYVFVYVVAYLGGMGFAYCLEQIGVPSWLALLLTTGALAVAVYFALNFWVFRERLYRA